MKRSTARAIGNLITVYIYAALLLCLGIGGVMPGAEFVGGLFAIWAIYQTIKGIIIYSK